MPDVELLAVPASNSPRAHRVLSGELGWPPGGLTCPGWSGGAGVFACGSVLAELISAPVVNPARVAPFVEHGDLGQGACGCRHRHRAHRDDTGGA